MTPQTQTMQAAAIDKFGDAVTLHTLPVPEVDADEILIRVEAADVGVWDPFEATGGFHQIYGGEARFPYILGSDGAGTVVEVGKDVRNFKMGDKVYAMSLMNPKGGFYAQFVAVKAQNASLIPGNLPVEQAGALPVDAITALRGLDDSLKLQKGESVLIFGASGGIGHLAVQLAKRMGARVFAVASGADGVELARKLGADLAVDGKIDDIGQAAQKFSPGGLDAALLTAGGPAAEQALLTVKAGGRGAYPNGVQPEPKKRAGLTLTAYNGEAGPEVIARLNRLIEMGPFHVQIAQSFPLDQAGKAHQELRHHSLGKRILKPS